MGEILIGMDMRDFHPFVCGNMNNRGIEGGDALKIKRAKLSKLRKIVKNEWKLIENCELDINKR